MLVRIRSRDGLERVTVDSPNCSVGELKTLIEKQLQIPREKQTLSSDQKLLLAVKSGEGVDQYSDMCDPCTPLCSLGVSHGSIVFLAYEGERSVPGPPVSPAGSFGRKMTMDDLIAKQMRVSRQESPHCSLVSFDRDCAHAFQHYVNHTLAFSLQRGGFMYGSLSPDSKVEVHFIYEPPQQGSPDSLLLLRDPLEEQLVDAIALSLGMRRLGFIFTQTLSQANQGYTLSNRDLLQAAHLHSDSGLKEWVTALVKLELNPDGAADVHFEAFQMSDMCLRLFKEGWMDTDIRPDDDPKLSKMTKDVVVGVKDTKEVDNDFFLVLVKIFDHQGPLTTTFPIENRITSVTMRDLKNHLDRTKSLSFVKRISDFHLLLLLARFLDLNADVPALAQCVLTQTPIPEGYKLLIESMASAS